MDMATPGDLVYIMPYTSIYPAAYSSPGAPHAGPDHVAALIVETSDHYRRVLLPGGTTAWVHVSSCRPARKADRT